MSGTTLTSFTPGDLVIEVYGAASGSGTYTLDQASAITLEELTPTGTVVGTLVLPQTTTVVNGTTEYAVSGEYGSASEGIIQLSADGRSLALLGYGVNAAAFDAAGTAGTSPYGTAALGQTSSVAGGVYTPVARIVANIGYNATIDTSTSLNGIYTANNPRSVATVNGTTFYLSGQSVKGSTTQGVFVARDASTAAAAIDTSTDTREAEIVNGQLYVSRDTTQGGATGTTNIASYGATLPTGATAPTPLAGITGQVMLGAAQANSVNATAVGTTINLSPQSFFFANATTLYVADSGFPKNGGIGDGGLQKWTFNGTSWSLAYTLSAGLNLVPDTATTGTTGLFGLTGSVSSGTVQLYATTTGAGELDQSFLYGITDTLAATAAPAGESFTQLAASLPNSAIRGVAFAPSAPVSPGSATSVAPNQSISGLVVSSGGSLSVAVNGTATSSTILSGGSESTSGQDIATYVAHGATESVYAAATGDLVAGAQQVLAATASVMSETVLNGGVVTLAAGSLISATVASGGTVSVTGSGVASATTISGGTVALLSPGASVTGVVTFAGPGTLAVGVLPSAGAGLQAVVNGFGPGDVIDIQPIAFAGAQLTAASVGGNTVETVTNGGSSASFTLAGAPGATVGLKGDANGAAELAYVPPPSSNVTVSSGATSTGLVIGGGSTLTVAAGGTVIGTTLLPGATATVAGTESGTTLSAGASETMLGSANADQIYGLQLVSAGTALVTNETVHAGGVVNDFLKGAVLTGTTIQNGGTLNISGNTTASNTVLSAGGVINLQSPKASVTGTLTFSGGGTLEESATVSAGFGDLAVLRGFTSGAAVDLTGISPVGATLTSTTSGGNTIETVSGGGVSQSFTFSGTYAPGYFVLGADAGSGTQITTNVPCYCRGTRIATPGGEVPVEQLAIGDQLVTASGAIRAVRWIGRRSYAGRFTCGNRTVLPVLIRAGALADGIPRRDLFVSPLHAMFLDGLLIPAKSLINGHSIVQVGAMDRIDYVHVELDTHDVILAEGAAAESFLDDDSRSMFHNAAEHAAVHGELALRPGTSYAPRVEDGALLEPVWQRLAARGGCVRAA